MSSFSNPGAVATYAENAVRNVPALRDLHRMACLLLAEKVPSEGRVLVLGAGGGLELKAFAQMQPGWRFDGVDPSRPMLEQARATLGEQASRVSFHDGYIDDAPMGPFDGAACLLTLHFLSREERIRTLKQIRARLGPGAPLVTAHHSFPNNDAAKDKWLSRFAAFVASSGPLPAGFDTQTMKQRMPFLSPEQDLSALEDAGFVDIELFYAAFTFKGWVAYNTASPIR